MSNKLKVAEDTQEPKQEEPKKPIAFVIPADLTDAIMTIVTKQPWDQVQHLITAFKTGVQPVYAQDQTNDKEN